MLRNNYVIDELLNSGKILFGDSLTSYVNDIASVLLKDDESLRDALRFYVVKSNEVNAFATNQGIIFITVGMIAQVENEAQLAFVLAHEIAHYEKEHSIASILESEKIYNRDRNDKYNGYEDRIRLLSSFSKELELEADSIGYERLIKSGYNPKAASTTMDVLQFAFLPFDDVEFTGSFMELDSFRFPNHLFLDSLAPIPLNSDDFDDSESTHPNISRRRDVLDMRIEKNSVSTNTYFILGKTRFEGLQHSARREMIHLDLVEQQYVDALYNSFVLITKDKEDQFLEESIAKALYGISKYKNGNDFSDIGVGSDDAFSHLQNCYALFENLEKEQVNLLAIRYLIEVENKYHSPFITMLTNDLIKEGIKRNDLTQESFEAGLKKCEEAVQLSKDLKLKEEEEKLKAAEEKNGEKKLVETQDTVVKPLEEETSKYDKLRKEKKKALAVAVDDNTKGSSESTPWDNIFHFQTFAGGGKQAMSIRIDSLELVVENQNKADEDWVNEVRNRKKFYQRKGYSLGIDKVVFVDPFFFKADERSGLKLEDSEKELMEFKGQIEDCADACKLEHEVLFPKAMSAYDMDKYNTMAMMNDWVGEKLSHESNDLDIIPLETEYTAALSDTYGTDYFCYTGVFTSKMRRPGAWSTVIGCIILYPLLPLALVRAFTPLRQTYYYFLLYNGKMAKRNGHLKRL